MKESPAIREWREKVEVLEIAEAREVDAATKFKLGKEIAEATARLKELLAQDSNVGPAGAPAPAELFGRETERKAPLTAAPSAHAAELAAETSEVEASPIDGSWLGWRIVWLLPLVAVAVAIVIAWQLWRPIENPPPAPRPPRPIVTILGSRPTDAGNDLVGRRTGIDKDDPHTVITVWTCKSVCRSSGTAIGDSLGEWHMLVPSGEVYVAAAVTVGYRGEDAQDVDTLRRRLGAQYGYDEWPRLSSPKSSGSGWGCLLSW